MKVNKYPLTLSLRILLLDIDLKRVSTRYLHAEIYSSFTQHTHTHTHTRQLECPSTYAKMDIVLHLSKWKTKPKVRVTRGHSTSWSERSRSHHPMVQFVKCLPGMHMALGLVPRPARTGCSAHICNLTNQDVEEQKLKVIFSCIVNQIQGHRNLSEPLIDGNCLVGIDTWDLKK